MTEKIIKRILLICSFLPFLACAAAAVGPQTIKKYDYENFDTIVNKCAVTVKITPGTDYSIQVKGDADYINALDITLRGRQLKIDYRRPSLFNPDNPKQSKVYIGLPSVQTVVVKGSGSVKILAENNSDDFSAKIKGSGDFSCQKMSVGDLSIEQSGSGRANFAKKVQAKEALVHLNGSGTLNMEELACATIAISTSGSGDVNIKKLTADQLQSNLTGNGNLTLKGAAANLNYMSTGSSQLDAKELTARGAEVKLTGSGSAELSVADQSQVRLWVTGSGTIDIYGNPIVQERKRLGSGQIKIH